MTHDAARISGQLTELSEPEFRALVEKVLGGMGLESKGFRSSGDSIEMDAREKASGDAYLVYASRRLGVARPHDVQKAVERMRKAGVPRAIYITSGGVSPEAEEYAAQFDVAVADAERFGQLLDKFGLSDELERRSVEAFLAKDGDRHLPSMGQLESMMKWGYDFHASGNYRKAIEYFEKAAALKPDYDVPYSMLGGCHIALGQADKAVEFYEEALRRNPDSEEGWFNLGAALFSLGKHDDELACYDKALQLNAGYGPAWNNKGATLLLQGKDEEAVLCFDKALKSNPKNEGALVNRGAALRRLGRKEEALASLDEAIAANSGNLDAWLNRGLLLQEMGRHLDASKSYDRVLEKFRTAELYAQKASALMSAGLHKAALDALDKAIAMKPGWDVAVEMRATAESALRLENEKKTASQQLMEQRREATVPGGAMPPKPADAQIRPEVAAKPSPPPKTDGDIGEAPAPSSRPDGREPLFSSLEDFATGRSEDGVIFTCSECGAEVGERDNFCQRCGSDLREGDRTEEIPEDGLPAGEPAEVEMLEEARAEEREALEFDELVGKGEACLRLGLFEDAIGCFGEAMLLRRDARLAAMQGSAAYALGRFDEAAAFFDDALEREPGSARAAWGLAESLREGGNLAASSEAMEDVANQVDLSVPLLMMSADMYESWGKPKKALEALEASAELVKWSADVSCKLGTALLKSEKPDDALRCFDRAIQSEPGHWEAWCARGSALAARGDIDQAIKSFDRAMGAEPDATAPMAGKAAALMVQGRPDEALELIDDALTFAASPELFAMKSFALLESDDLDGAIEAADAGLKLDGRSAELWNLRGLALMRAGKTADALEAFEEAVAIAPDFSDAVKNLKGLEGEIDASGPLKKKSPKAKAQAPAKSEGEQPSRPEPPRRLATVACNECGEENDFGSKRCAACGAKLAYKSKEDALTREMEDAISEDRAAPRKKGSKKQAKRDRESFIRELMSVPGIGYARASDIWEAGFRSEDDIHRAEMAELTRIAGITPTLARKLKKGI